MKGYLLVCLLLLLSLKQAEALLTRSMLKKKSNSNGQYLNATLKTTCNVVDLNKKYNYKDVVRSGYLSVGKGNSALAFLFYGKKGATVETLKSIPTIIWLNGGPGSSSQIGNLQELGPLTFKDSETELTANEHSWVNSYNVLFIDQPVGTGLSYADQQAGAVYVNSTTNAAKDFYYALDQLYNNQNGCFSHKFLNIPGTAPLVIFGESYAGKYVPAIAKTIIQANGFLKGLKGIGIGDGFTDPFAILAEVGTYSYHRGLLDFEQNAVVNQMLLKAAYQNKKEKLTELHDTFDDTLEYIVAKSQVNIYDITVDGDYPEKLEVYFSNQEIIELYNLNPEVKYGSQGEAVYEHMYEDFMKSQTADLEEVIHTNLEVLIYNGQDDLIVQNPGTMRWLDNLNIPQRNQLREGLFEPWMVDNHPAGHIKTAKNVQFRIVFNAGHLVPMNQPKNAEDMMKSFMKKCGL